MTLIKFPEEIDTTYKGFNLLARLYYELKDKELSSIKLDMSKTTWFDANMCAALGAVLYKIGNRNNSIKIENINPNIQEVLSKNRFLDNYGYKSVYDTYKTTIKYLVFSIEEERMFGDYIDRYLRNKGIPEMTSALRNRFLKNISEIFNNAVIHSKTKQGIFACGQYFPHRKLLKFSIADLGIGFRRNIERKLNTAITSEDAIEWAMSGNNTTKTGRIPGGLGLKILQEFIRMNKGRIQICSEDGYWELHEDIMKRHLHWSFPGSVVNIEIRTDDPQSYMLSNEKGNI